MQENADQQAEQIIHQHPLAYLLRLDGVVLGLGDYLRDALPHGYLVRACKETYGDATRVEPDELPTPLTPAPPISGSCIRGRRRPPTPPRPASRRLSDGTSN